MDPDVDIVLDDDRPSKISRHGIVQDTALVSTSNSQLKALQQQKRLQGDDADTAEHKALRARARAAQQKYGRGAQIRSHAVKDKKLRANLRSLEKKYRDATLKAKDAEILLENDAGFLEAEGELERTYKIRQDEIKPHVSAETAKKGFELKLSEQMGPYTVDYTPNGRGMLLSGRKGHVAAIPDWRAGTLGCELQLGETVREVRWLHNEQYFAAAQKKYVYIYDRAGVELHCLRQHIDVLAMEFLRYHFLLASVGNAGWLKYTDTSTGQLVSEMSTKQGTPTCLAQNPWNAIMHVGHQNGTVTLWSPNSTSPLVKILAHRGPVRAAAIDRQGRYMVTTGQDQKMGVWDIRMYKQTHEYFLRRPGSSVAISDRGLCAVGWGTQTSVWRGLFDSPSSTTSTTVDDDTITITSLSTPAKVQSPYMSWGAAGQTVSRLRWCPFEDILGISHSQGFSSIIVPGAGEPNYDATELNPYESVKQRQEGEVKSLLNKLQPEMISLTPDFVGSLDQAKAAEYKKQADLDRPLLGPQVAGLQALERVKNRGKGKNSSLRKFLRKKAARHVIDDERVAVEELRKETNRKTAKTRPGAGGDGRGAGEEDDMFAASLGRFTKKKR